MILRHILWVLILMNLSDSILGQSFLSNLNLSLDYSILQQDKRLFNFPGRNEVIENSKNTYHDHVYGIIMSKNIFEYRRFSFDAGIGYSIYDTRFQRPFEHHYFTDNVGNEDLRYINRYFNHRIKINNEVNFKLFGKNENTIIFAVPFDLNISVNKSIRSERVERYKTFSKWRAEFSNLGVHSGIKYKNRYAYIAVYFRVFNIQKIDRVIFNSILWGSSGEFPKIQDNEFEIKNWTALRVKFGIILNKNP